MACGDCDFYMAEYIIRVGTKDAVKPTVVAELIRCRDCRYRQRDFFGDGYVCTYHVLTFNVKDEDFCNYGKRRKNKDGGNDD